MNRPSLRTGAFVALTLAGALMLSSCSEQIARNTLQETSALIAEMENQLGGAKHAPAELDNLKKQVAAANEKLAGGDASTAKDEAKAALATAEQLRTSVVNKEANVKYDEALQEIRIADINDGPKLGEDVYRQIIALKTQAEEARGKQEWEDLINICNQIISRVNDLLTQRIAEVDRAETEAQRAFDDLKAEGGNELVPEVMIAVQDTIVQGQRAKSREVRDLKNAVTLFQNAKTQAKDGILQVKQERSRQRLDEIASLLATALLEGAEEYLAEEYNRNVELHEGLLRDFEEERYERVLDGAEQIKPKVQTLVFNTKREASIARKRTIELNIKELSEGGARRYLPGRVEGLESILTQVSTELAKNTEPAFDTIKAIAIEAADVNDSIRRAFSDLATEAIRVASNQVDTTRGVFEQSRGVFEPITGEMTPDQRAFEAQKATRMAEISNILERAREDLGIADLRQKDQKFEGAILLSQQIKTTAETTLNELYHVVGHNATIELANLISRYERDGAREYADAELARSTRSLEDVKRLIAEGKFRESVNMAAVSRAEVELMAQRVAGRATVNLREAREAFRAANSEKVMKYRSQQLDQVRQLIDEAEKDLAANRLKLAVERADSARILANEARREALRQSSTEALARAAAEITRAQNAGAELYAGRELDDAKKLLSTGQTLFASQDFERAESLAGSSFDRANQALFKKINDAEAAIANAKAAGGWEYSDARLSAASNRVRQARTELEAGRYAESASLADSARSGASDVALDSRASGYRKTISRIQNNIEAGEAQGINFFQPNEAIAARKRLFELQNMYSSDNHELVMTELAKLESSLRKTLDTTAQTVLGTADAQEKRLAGFEEAGAGAFAAPLIAEARRNIQVARLDFRRGLHTSADSALRRAVSLGNEIEQRLVTEKYADDFNALVDEFRSAMAGFRPMLELGPASVKLIASQRPAGGGVIVSTPISPKELRDRMEVVYARAEALQPASGQRARQEAVKEAFNGARVAAIQFEKFASLNTVSAPQANAIVDEAFLRIRTAEQTLAVIQEQLASERVRFRSQQVQANLGNQNAGL